MQNRGYFYKYLYGVKLKLFRNKSIKKWNIASLQCSIFFFNIVQFQFNKHLLQRTDSKIHHLNIPEMGIIQKVER